MTIRQALGIPVDQRGPSSHVIPAATASMALNDDALRALTGYHVLLPGTIDETAMYDRGYRYPNLGARRRRRRHQTGYGIISNASLTTPRSSTSRGDFRDGYQVLVDAMPKYLAVGSSSITPICSAATGSHISMRCSRSQIRRSNLRPTALKSRADILLNILG